MSDESLFAQVHRCDVYLCVIQAHSVNSANLYVQLDIAKTFNKPVRAFIQSGVCVPDGFFDGLKDLVIYEFENVNELPNGLLTALKSVPSS